METQQQEIAELKEKLASTRMPKSASAFLDDKAKPPSKWAAEKEEGKKLISPERRPSSKAGSSRTKPGSKKASPAGKKPTPLNKRLNLVEQKLTPLGVASKAAGAEARDGNGVKDKQIELEKLMTQKEENEKIETELIDEANAPPELDEIVAAQSGVLSEDTQAKEDTTGARAKARAKAAAMMSKSGSSSRSPQRPAAVSRSVTQNEPHKPNGSFDIAQEREDEERKEGYEEGEQEDSPSAEAKHDEQKESLGASKRSANKDSQGYGDSKLLGLMAPLKFKTYEKLTRTQKIGTGPAKDEKKADTSHKSSAGKASASTKPGTTSKQKKSPNATAKKSSKLAASSTVPHIRSVSASGHARRPQ